MRYNWVFILSLSWFSLSFTFIVFVSMKNSVGRILPSWFSFMEDPWQQKLNAIISSEGWVWCVTDVIIFHFRPFFALSPPSQPKKSKLKKIEKNPLEILSFYTSVPKSMIICYTAPEIWHETDVIVIFHFGLLPFYLPNSPKNQN